MKRSIVSLALSLAAVGCAGSQGEQVKDARAEQINESAAADKAAIDARADARGEAIEESFDNREDKVAATDRPGADATEELVEVNEERTMFQSEATAELNKLAVRINAAGQQLSMLGGRAPSELKYELQTATQEHTQLKREVTALDKTPSTVWEQKTEQIEQRIARLNDRVSELADEIQDV